MRFWKGSCGLLALLWVGCGAVWAGDSSTTKNNCEAEDGKHLLWENDVITGKLFGRSDKWYTNGFKFYSSDQPDCVPAYWFDFLHDRIEALRDVPPGGNPAYSIQTGNVIGQLMFTPKNLTVAAPQPADRFWGGWLYLGVVAQRKPYEKGSAAPGKLDGSELETLELDFGVTGPISGAEQVQRVVHALSNSTMPAGWGNQIRTEPAIQFNYSRIKRTWKYPDNEGDPHLDFSWHYGGAAGTLFDYVNGGATFRFGGRLADEAPNVIESPSIGQFGKPRDAVYGLVRLDMKGVIHNAFIDGSLFRGQPHASSLGSKHIVPQFTFGGVFEWKYANKQEGARASLLVHRRGSEFSSPAGPGAIFNFATLNVEWDLGK